MKFYDCKTAPSPRRVRVFAAEKGIELDTVQVDLGNGEQFSDEFRAKNPDCVVPVLELADGTCLTEVIAICQYLEELYPEPTLFGETPEERAVTMMWNAKAELQGLWAMADAFRNTVKGLQGHALPGPDAYEQIPELAVRGKARVEAFFVKMNERLASHEYLAGERFTIADITALVLFDFAARMRINPAEDQEYLRRWYASVSARPSAGA